jgi:peptidoglycan hydrolase-like protein with peptidoglycan-binding domain
MKAGIKEDGVFGKKTDTFVRKFQAENKETVLAPWNLKKPTGIVYITTLAAINNAVCPELKLPIPKDLVPPSQNPLF